MVCSGATVTPRCLHPPPAHPTPLCLYCLYCSGHQGGTAQVLQLQVGLGGLRSPSWDAAALLTAVVTQCHVRTMGDWGRSQMHQCQVLTGLTHLKYVVKQDPPSTQCRCCTTDLCNGDAEMKVTVRPGAGGRKNPPGPPNPKQAPATVLDFMSRR